MDGEQEEFCVDSNKQARRVNKEHCSSSATPRYQVKLDFLELRLSWVPDSKPPPWLLE